MGQHKASITWKRGNAQFSDNKYSRRHEWSFDGGAVVSASSSPHVVPVPYSDPTAIDPEEALIASLSSCHMLWFLSIAAQQGFIVDSYQDNAIGVMEKDQSDHLAITRVTLRPAVSFPADQAPSTETLLALHHAAHDSCFIARSVKCEVLCEPVI